MKSNKNGLSSEVALLLRTMSRVDMDLTVLIAKCNGNYENIDKLITKLPKYKQVHIKPSISYILSYNDVPVKSLIGDMLLSNTTYHSMPELDKLFENVKLTGANGNEIKILKIVGDPKVRKKPVSKKLNQPDHEIVKFFYDIGEFDRVMYDENDDIVLEQTAIETLIDIIDVLSNETIDYIIEKEGISYGDLLNVAGHTLKAKTFQYIITKMKDSGKTYGLSTHNLHKYTNAYNLRTILSILVDSKVYPIEECLKATECIELWRLFIDKLPLHIIKTMEPNHNTNKRIANMIKVKVERNK